MTTISSLPTDVALVRQEKKQAKKQAFWRQILFVLVIFATSSLLWMAYTYNGFGSLPLRWGWLLMGGGCLALTIAIRYVWELDWLSPLIAYALTFWVFHFGLIVPVAINPQLIGGWSSYARDWLFLPETEMATIIATVFYLTYSLAIMVFPHRLERPYQWPNKQELITSGGITIVAGMIGISIALLQYGGSVLFSSYEFFFAINNSFSWPIIVIATGLMLQLAGGRSIKDVLITSTWTLIPIAVLVTLAGSRTAPLFSMTAIACIFYMRHLKLPPYAVAIGLTGLLLFISVIRETRSSGVLQVLTNTQTIQLNTPVSGLMELGHSLKPVTTTLDYLKYRDFFYGQTYLFPFVRQVQRFFDSRTDINDERFIALRFSERYGAIGFSTAAEAYINGGFMGVVVFAFLWGLLLSWLTSTAVTPYSLARLSVFLIPMLINVRNSFIYVPVWIAIGFIPILLAYFVLRRTSKSRR